MASPLLSAGQRLKTIIERKVVPAASLTVQIRAKKKAAPGTTEADRERAQKHTETFGETLRRNKLLTSSRKAYMRYAKEARVVQRTVEEDVAVLDKSSTMQAPGHLRALHAVSKSKMNLDETNFDCEQYLHMLSLNKRNQPPNDTSNNGISFDRQLAKQYYRATNLPNPFKFKPKRPEAVPFLKMSKSRAAIQLYDLQDTDFRKASVHIVNSQLKSLLASLEDHTLLSMPDRVKVEKLIDENDKEAINALMRGYAIFVDNKSTGLLVNCIKQIIHT